VADTSEELDDEVLDGGEPVLVWAVREDILLANDAALLLLARSTETGPLRDTGTALARTLARVVSGDGSSHRSGGSLRRTAEDSSPRECARSEPVAVPVTETGQGWPSLLARLSRRLQAVLGRPRRWTS